MTILRLARWHLPSVAPADYYGHCWGLVVGPVLIMVGSASDG